MINLDVMSDQYDVESGNNGKVKKMNGVNGFPRPIAPGYPDLQQQFNEMEITDIRLHDTYGPLDIDNFYTYDRSAVQLIVNVPENERNKARKLLADFGNLRTIFPNAAIGMRLGDLSLALKDANYEIADAYLRDLINNEEKNPKCIQRQVIFRIGRSVAASCMKPENTEIYAALVANLVDRYSNNASLNGLKRKVSYWEIWNEPDIGDFWNESVESFCRFYAKIEKAIKNVDAEAKVGGAGFLILSTIKSDYLDVFLPYCQLHKIKLDFLAWHSYGIKNPKSYVTFGNYVKSRLVKYGFSETESILSEWNTTPIQGINTFTKLQGIINATYIASTLIQCQNAAIDKAYYYRADGASFGIFNRAPNPKKPEDMAYCTYSAQVFKLFSMMLTTPNIIRSTKIKSTGFSFLTARSDDKINILVSNYKINPDLHNANVKPLTPYYEQYYINSERSFTELNDKVSRDLWFGGKDPKLLYSNNAVEEFKVSKEIINDDDNLYDYYSESQDGLTINLYGLKENFKSLTVHRIYEGGDLSSLTPEKIDTDGMFSHDDKSLVIKDKGAVEYTVTLYSIELKENFIFN